MHESSRANKILEISNTDEIAAIACGEKQELFLDVRSQVQQIHDLADPGRGDAAELREIGKHEVHTISQVLIE
jgi:hypothetical protein